MILVKPVSHSELSHVYKIAARSFKEPTTPHYFRVIHALSGSYFLVALRKESQAVVGYVVGVKTKGMCHIASIAVEPAARRHRVGSMLLQSLTYLCSSEGVSEFFLEVNYKNYAAQLFYLKNGFSPLFMIKDYYGEGRHAIVMAGVYLNDVSSLAYKLKEWYESIEHTFMKV